MSDKIVYVLGAGFSAPLGLPVIGNFLSRAKDLLQDRPADFADFKLVFELFDKLHKTSAFYNSDQFNIEEILSILTMRSLIEGDERQISLIKKFVADVVKAYTPKSIGDNPGRFAGARRLPELLFSSLFELINSGLENKEELAAGYGGFVANVLGLQFESVQNGSLQEVICRGKDPHTEYVVVSLNYDLILEMVCEYISSYYKWKVTFERRYARDLSGGGYLAKLHGSVDEEIIPPTWNKALVGPKVIDAWKIARSALAQANHIRFIGYSLPPTDSYIQYLFKESVLECAHLKSIDIICMDPTGAVKNNYRSLVKFKNTRFVSSTTENYLMRFRESYVNRSTASPLLFSADGLERLHSNFMHQARNLHD